MSDRVKLFVGCAANGEDAESMAVLEYTVRYKSSLPVDIVWMHISNDPLSMLHGWATEKWATPFSGFRWAVPELAGFKGKAIYCDSDFIWMSDIAKLWNQEFEPGKIVMAKGGEDTWRYCCAMWDCAEAQRYLVPLSRMKVIPDAHQRYMNFFSNNKDLVQPFQGNWNCIDGEDLPIDKIDALHYSDMSTQFHLQAAIKRLAKTGEKHWFDGEVRPHWRTDLKNYFNEMLILAEHGGWNVEDYVPAGPRIEYKKESQKEYRNAHKWSK
jgi:lipopolysaccharide biosynthesis glycosyltransferase